MFQFQYKHNKVYGKWCDLINRQSEIKNSKQLPTINNQPSTAFHFLPISFFKSHTIATTLFQPQQIFESSGTTNTTNSKHLVKDVTIYQQSFIKAFEIFYGNITDYCIIGLLPSYLDREKNTFFASTIAFFLCS